MEITSGTERIEEIDGLIRFYRFTEEQEEYIKEVTLSLKNVTCISGYDFVPENEVFFADLRLHPNDKGFQKQFARLYDKMKKYL